MSEKDGPRPVTVGTCSLAPFEDRVKGGNEERLANGLAMIDAMAGRADELGRPLDLVVLPEAFAQRGKDRELQTADGDLVGTVAARCARYRTNGVAPAVLRDDDGTKRNAAVFIDREGRTVGVYRKMHPVLHDDGRLEDGTVPGTEPAVFDLDFGRVGALICFDQFYDDTWGGLAANGAELVVHPTACCGVAEIRANAWRYHYYVLSSTFRPPAVLVDPIGREKARTAADREVLVETVDLDYRIISWNALKDFGGELGKKYGERIRMDWHMEEDLCILTSNDPNMPVQRVMDEEGLFTTREFLERNRVQHEGERR